MMSQFAFGPHVQTVHSQYARATQAAAACHARNAYQQVAGGVSRWVAHSGRNEHAHQRTGAGARTHGQPRFTAPGGKPHASAPEGELPQTLEEAYATLHVQPGAPEPVVKAAYRALAQVHHPDAGGDAEAMTRINAAYAAIQRRHH